MANRIADYAPPKPPVPPKTRAGESTSSRGSNSASRPSSGGERYRQTQSAERYRKPQRAERPRSAVRRSAPAPAPQRSSVTNSAPSTPSLTPAITTVAPMTTAPTPAPEPQFKTIEVPDAKADSVYQRQVADLARAMANYQAQNSLAKKQYDTNYNQTLGDMGWTDNGWARQGSGNYAKDYGANEGDFAGRGAYWSGVYGQSVNDMNNAYNQMKTGLDTARTQYQDSQNLANSQYTEQNQLDQQNALQSAVARLAAQYGVQNDQVPVGTGPVKIQQPINGG